MPGPLCPVRRLPSTTRSHFRSQGVLRPSSCRLNTRAQNPCIPSPRDKAGPLQTSLPRLRSFRIVHGREKGTPGTVPSRLKGGDALSVLHHFRTGEGEKRPFQLWSSYLGAAVGAALSGFRIQRGRRGRPVTESPPPCHPLEHRLTCKHRTRPVWAGRCPGTPPSGSGSTSRRACAQRSSERQSPGCETESIVNRF